MQPGKIVAISDLHLWGPKDPLYRGLIRFIDSRLEPGDKFFIVGDLFDLFIGSKAVFAARYHELVQKLRELETRDVEVFYIEGNHDFHLENIFEDNPHVRIYSDSLDYEWRGKKFHFCHGDRVNKGDVKYAFFHFLTRNLVSQCVIDVAPGRLVDRVGRFMAKASRGSHELPSADDKVIQIFRNYACEQISNGYDYVIMGHSHYLDDMRFRVGSHEGQYVNVGYPRKHRKYLEFGPDDAVFQLKIIEELVPLRPTTPDA